MTQQPTPPPPSETKLSEAIDKFDALTQEVGRRVASRDAILKQDVLDAKNAARSSLESLYRETLKSRDDWERLAKGWQHETEVRDRQILELSALRSLQLTEDEAAATARILELNQYSAAPSLTIAYKKLRRISSKATSEEL